MQTRGKAAKEAEVEHFQACALIFVFVWFHFLCCFYFWSGGGAGAHLQPN